MTKYKSAVATFDEFGRCVSVRGYDPLLDKEEPTIYYLMDPILEVLKANNKTIEDIEYVNCHKKSISWEEFYELIKMGYSEDECVSDSLKIIGKDWWIENIHTDDYHTNFEFKTQPMRYNNSKQLNKDEIYMSEWEYEYEEKRAKKQKA